MHKWQQNPCLFKESVLIPQFLVIINFICQLKSDFIVTVSFSLVPPTVACELIKKNDNGKSPISVLFPMFELLVTNSFDEKFEFHLDFFVTISAKKPHFAPVSRDTIPIPCGLMFSTKPKIIHFFDQQSVSNSKFFIQWLKIFF